MDLAIQTQVTVEALDLPVLLFFLLLILSFLPWEAWAFSLPCSEAAASGTKELSEAGAFLHCPTCLPVFRQPAYEVWPQHLLAV